MFDRLIGWPFIAILSPIVALTSVLFAYRIWRDEDAARNWAALAILILVPVSVFGTMPWRLGVPQDSPEFGLALYLGAIESFWSWCAGIALLFAVHGIAAKRAEKWRSRYEFDPDTFE